jgi:hypothetical protein
LIFQKVDPLTKDTVAENLPQYKVILG